MQTILKYASLGIIVAAIGLCFSELFRMLFNGLQSDTGRLLGMGVWLCLVICTASGMILAELKKHR